MSSTDAGYTYGAGAALTGPCLVNMCSGTSSSTPPVCGASIQLCTSQSISFTNPVDSTDLNEKCSYNYALDNIVRSCDSRPLSGQLGGSGDTWSIFDNSATVTVKPTVVQATNGADITILYVPTTAILQHFLDGGSAAAAAATQTTTSTSAPAAHTAAPLNTAPVTSAKPNNYQNATSGYYPTGTGSAKATLTSTSVKTVAPPISSATNGAQPGAMTNAAGRTTTTNVVKGLAIGALVVLALCA